MPRQAKRIRPKSIGFNNVRASLQIVMMQVADQVRLREVQLVIAAVDENPFGVQQRAHSAVAQDRAIASDEQADPQP